MLNIPTTAIGSDEDQIKAVQVSSSTFLPGCLCSSKENARRERSLFRTAGQYPGVRCLTHPLVDTCP